MDIFQVTQLQFNYYELNAFLKKPIKGATTMTIYIYLFLIGINFQDWFFQATWLPTNLLLAILINSTLIKTTSRGSTWTSSPKLGDGSPSTTLQALCAWDSRAIRLTLVAGMWWAYHAWSSSRTTSSERNCVLCVAGKCTSHNIALGTRGTGTKTLIACAATSGQWSEASMATMRLWLNINRNVRIHRGSIAHEIFEWFVLSTKRIDSGTSGRMVAQKPCENQFCSWIFFHIHSLLFVCTLFGIVTS